MRWRGQLSPLRHRRSLGHESDVRGRLLWLCEDGVQPASRLDIELMHTYLAFDIRNDAVCGGTSTSTAEPFG